MSSILEALKKLEEEKSARRAGDGNIAGKVTRPGRRPRPRPWWFLPALMAAVAGIAMLATFALMGGFSPRRGASPPVATATVQPQPPAAAPAATPAPLAPAPPVPPNSGTLPTRQARTAVARPAPQVALPGQTATAATAPQQATPPPAEKPAPPQTTAASTIPLIRVSGIAWQKESADRLAMVNGKAVGEGGTVEGARVVEILPDRVRFSIADRAFEIPLGKSSRD